MVKSWANGSVLEPGPHRNAARRQRRQVAQILVAFARAVKIGADRSEQTERGRAPRPVAVLVRRMAAGHHFHADSARVLESLEQCGAVRLIELVASRVRQYRQAAG